MRQVFGRDAFAGVADAQETATVVQPAGFDFHPAGAGVVVDAIAGEVDDRLAEALRVSTNRCCGEHGADVYAGVFGERREELGAVRGELVEFDGFGRERCL